MHCIKTLWHSLNASVKISSYEEQEKKEFKVWDSLTTEKEPNSHQRNTSLETWQGCGGAGSEDKSLLPIPVLKQCVDQTAV